MKKLLVAACLLVMSHGFGLAQSTITIGDTNIEAAADGDKRSLLLAQQVALSQTATIHSLSFYVMAAHGELRLGIYDASGPGGAPGVRKAQTHSFAPQVGWNTHHVITPVSLAPGNYWLAYLPSGNKLGFVKQNNSGNCWYIKSDFNQVLPHTFPSNAISCNPTTWSFYATLKVDAPVNGQCGSANGKAVSSAPAAGLCSLGTASAVTGSGPWNWSCTGSNGGTTASCSAPFSPAPTNGQCGSANGVVVSTAPATGLCSVGLASSVTGTGPWNWSCAGSNDGTTASCSAPLKSSGTGIIPANRMTTWQPGVTYNGGIPNRTTVCATLSPLGGTQDDTAQIQRAINNCPSGQVVKLNAGTFNIYTSIVIANSNVTLRGAGPGTGASGGIHAPSDLLGAGSVVTGGGTGTFLVKQNRNTNNYGLLQISGSSMNDVQDSTNLASDAVLGAYSVTLASNPGITVGTYVLIDENTDNDPDVVWGPSFGGPGDASRSWFSRQDRSLGQMMQVSAVNGNAITFARPFHHTYSVANQAQLTRFSTPWLTGVGVEDLAVMGDTGWGNITMTRCAGCWIKHIEVVLLLGDLYLDHRQLHERGAQLVHPRDAQHNPRGGRLFDGDRLWLRGDVGRE